jgi:hypothetical protein
VERSKDEELAEFFERRRGDVSLWSDTPSKVNVQRGGTVVFSVRFGREELALLKAWAEAEGRTVSELIRGAVLERTREAVSMRAVTMERWFGSGQLSYSLVTADRSTAGRANTVVQSPRVKDGYVLVSSHSDVG